MQNAKFKFSEYVIARKFIEGCEQMADTPAIPPKHTYFPPIAEAADIPRPPAPKKIRDEEISAQKHQSKPPELKLPFQETRDLRRHTESIRRESQRVEDAGKTLMEFLRHGDPQISAEVVLAEAAILAQLPRRSKQRKKRFWELYRQWAWQRSTAVITSVIGVFRGKK